jgi:hypothetical protein
MYVPVPKVTGSNNDDVFYSRRGNGPFYRWMFEQVKQRWNVSRVVSNDFNSHGLSLATWKTVPPALQSRLSDHYLD